MEGKGYKGGSAMGEGATEANDGDTIQADRVTLDECIDKVLRRCEWDCKGGTGINYTVVPIETACMSSTLWTCARTASMASWMPRVTSRVVGRFAAATMPCTVSRRTASLQDGLLASKHWDCAYIRVRSADVDAQTQHYRPRGNAWPEADKLV